MKLDVTEYIDTLEHYRSNFEQVRDQFEQVLNDLGNYESEMGEAFVGETGDALREKVRQSVTDFRDNYFLLEESMQYAMNQIVAGAVEEFGEEGAVDTIEVLFERERLRKVVDYAIELFEETNRIMRNEDLIALEPLNIDKIEDCFSFFRSACNQVIGDVETFDQYVKQQMISVNDDIALLCERLNIEPYYIVGINENGEQSIILNEKGIFITSMEERYGFNRQESEIMWKLWESIEERYGSSGDQYATWVYFKLISEIGGYTGFEWNESAGVAPREFIEVEYQAVRGNSDPINMYYKNVTVTEESIIRGLREMGLSDDEIIIFKGAINRQHLFVNNVSSIENLGDRYTPTADMYKEIYPHLKSASKEEIDKFIEMDINRYYGNGDFAHMAATIAVGINPGGASWIANIGARGNDEKVFRSAGYYGDVTSVAYNPQMGYDDYIADLASDNIVRRMRESEEYSLGVAITYFDEASTGKINEAQEFLNNHGGLDGVRNELYGPDGSPYPRTAYSIEGDPYPYSDDEIRTEKAIEEVEKFLNALEKRVTTFDKWNEMMGE